MLLVADDVRSAFHMNRRTQRWAVVSLRYLLTSFIEARGALPVTMLQITSKV